MVASDMAYRLAVPEFGQDIGATGRAMPNSAIVSALAGPAVAQDELIRHVVTSTGLAPETAVRLVADVLAYFGETTEQFVRRRHSELHRRGHRNAAIWPVIAGELADRRVVAARLSERQLRRVVYG
jgi:hypothetical protein